MWSRVFVYGCNLLGAAVFLGVWTWFFAVISLVGPISLFLARVLAFGSFVFLVIFDLWWRYLQEPRTSGWRFIWPTTGGAIFFIPLWATVPIMAGFGLVLYVTAKS